MITLALAEDHQALIDGMKLFFQNEPDILIVGEANDGLELIELVKNKRPSVVVTDIRMPKCDGIMATKTIKKNYPETKVIAFSMFDQEQAIEQMKSAGASGYIMKNSSLQTVLDAIRTVARNETYFDNAISTKDIASKEVGDKLLYALSLDALCSLVWFNLGERHWAMHQHCEAANAFIAAAITLPTVSHAWAKASGPAPFRARPSTVSRRASSRNWSRSETRFESSCCACSFADAGTAS